MNSDFQNFIKGIDPKTLAEGIKKARQLSQTPEGMKMIEQIKNGGNIDGINREEIANALKQNPELLKKISDMLK